MHTQSGTPSMAEIESIFDQKGSLSSMVIRHDIIDHHEHLDNHLKMKKKKEKEKKNMNFCEKHVRDPCRSFGRRCSLLVREQRARFYILRRCITMLLCWRECGDP